jgi:hypothetical protein
MGATSRFSRWLSGFLPEDLICFQFCRNPADESLNKQMVNAPPASAESVFGVGGFCTTTFTGAMNPGDFANGNSEKLASGDVTVRSH